MIHEDILTVSFDGALLNDKSALCVARKRGDKTIVLKTVLGDQANILYYLLTEQNANAEIKSWWRGNFVIDKHAKRTQKKTRKE